MLSSRDLPIDQQHAYIILRTYDYVRARGPETRDQRKRRAPPPRSPPIALATPAPRPQAPGAPGTVMRKLKGVLSPKPPFFYERAQLAPYELTHVRASNIAARKI